MSGLSNLGSALASFLQGPPALATTAKTSPETRQARIASAQAGSDNIPKYPQTNPERTITQDGLAGKNK